MRITKVGYIGLGIMGESMARNILAAGYELVVWNRTLSKCDALKSQGTKVADSPRDLAAAGPEVIFINVSNTQSVEDVIFGDDGLEKGLSAGQIIIDNSTIDPIATKGFAARLEKMGVGFMDAPVSGGSTGAKNGTLSIMVGGCEDVFQRCLPVLQAIGKTIILLGEAGMGQACKACNQIAVACNLLGVCEAMAYAKKAGLSLDKMLNVVTNGAGSSVQMKNNGPKIAAGDTAPGFKIELLLKDLNIASSSAKELGLPLKATTLIADYLRQLTADGYGGNGTQTLSRILEKNGNFNFSE